MSAPLDGEGLVDGREEVFGQVRGQGDDGVEVLARVFRIQAAEEIAAGCIKREDFVSFRSEIGCGRRIINKGHQGGEARTADGIWAWHEGGGRGEGIRSEEELTAPSQRDPQPFQCGCAAANADSNISWRWLWRVDCGDTPKAKSVKEAQDIVVAGFRLSGRQGVTSPVTGL